MLTATWSWLDAVSGIRWRARLLKWSAGLLRGAGLEPLDITPSSSLEDDIRATLEALDDARVRDLHLWSLRGGTKSCVVTLLSVAPREPRWYRDALARFDLAHVTVEVQRCEHGHGGSMEVVAS